MTPFDTMESINSTSTRRTFATVKPGYESTYGHIGDGQSVNSGKRTKTGAQVSVVTLVDTQANSIADDKDTYADMDPYAHRYLVILQFRVLACESSEEAVTLMKKLAAQKSSCKVWFLEYDTDIHCFRASATCRYNKMTTWKLPYQAPIIGVHPGRANPLVQINPHIPTEETYE